MKRLLALAAALCVLVPAVAHADGMPKSCPVGHSQMGCSLPPTLRGVTVLPHGEIFPDVSMYQRTVNWQAVKTWQLAHGWRITGGVFKLGEKLLDPYALRNARALHSLHMAAVGYVFVRPNLWASTVIGWARRAGIKVVVLDEEVAGIQGTAGRVTPTLRAAGLTVVLDYHSADENFDTTAQGLGCWVADYGPSRPPGCSTGPRKAWQFTSYGSIPGVDGIVDESVSYGLLRLAVPSKPKPARLICFGKGATPKAARCAPVLKHYGWLISRHRLWQHELEHARTWDRRRGVQAAKLRKRYSR